MAGRITALVGASADHGVRKSYIRVMSSALRDDLTVANHAMNASGQWYPSEMPFSKTVRRPQRNWACPLTIKTKETFLGGKWYPTLWSI